MRMAAPLTIFCMLLLCSCQKEIDPLNITSRTDSTSLIDDSTLLVKWIDFAYDQPAGRDTVIFEQYTYDSQKRLLQSDLIDFDASGLRDKDERVNFYYQGADTLPYKSISSSFTLPAATLDYADTLYHKYLAGKIVTDSIAQAGSGYPAAYKYTYFANRIQINTVEYYPATPLVSISNVSFTKVNGNTATQTDTFSSGSPRFFTLTYDNYKNPFYKRLGTFGVDQKPYYTRSLQNHELVFEKNNPTEIIESVISITGIVEHKKFSYQYRRNGYPASAKVYYIDPAGTDSIREVFIYTKP